MTEFKNLSLIIGFEEFVNYEMNIDGVIRSISRDNLLFKWNLDNNGYLICNLYINGKHKMIRQHRAIALLFISNPDNKPVVDHINHNPADNRIENLRWCTHAENRRNNKVSCNNNFGLKNISKERGQGKYCRWRIRVMVNGKRISECFKCLEAETGPPDSVIARRDELLKEHHLEFSSF